MTMYSRRKRHAEMQHANWTIHAKFKALTHAYSSQDVNTNVSKYDKKPGVYSKLSDGLFRSLSCSVRLDTAVFFNM